MGRWTWWPRTTFPTAWPWTAAARSSDAADSGSSRSACPRSAEDRGGWARDSSPIQGLGSVEQRVGQQRQEFREVLSENEIIHQVRGLAQPARTTAAQRFELLVADRLVQLRAERAAVLPPGPPRPPRPQL